MEMWSVINIISVIGFEHVTGYTVSLSAYGFSRGVGCGAIFSPTTYELEPVCCVLLPFTVSGRKCISCIFNHTFSLFNCISLLFSRLKSALTWRVVVAIDSLVVVIIL